MTVVLAARSISGGISRIVWKLCCLGDIVPSSKSERSYATYTRADEQQRCELHLGFSVAECTVIFIRWALSLYLSSVAVGRASFINILRFKEESAHSTDMPMLRFVTNSTQVLVCVLILESLGDEWIIFSHTANASFIQDTQVQD